MESVGRRHGIDHTHDDDDDDPSCKTDNYGIPLIINRHRLNVMQSKPYLSDCGRELYVGVYFCGMCNRYYT